VLLPSLRTCQDNAMALPTLTKEERAAALLKAAAARKVRAELREKLKSGQLTLSDAFNRIHSDEAVSKMKVIALLESMPGVGKIRAENLMDRIGIAQSRRLRGLGPHQISALLAEFSS
jgi:transposase